MDNTADIHNQYLGFNNTPLLWEGDVVMRLPQFSFPDNFSIDQKLKTTYTPRLGKLVEQFLSAKLNQSSYFSEIIENIQIQKDKRTIGELDFILKHEKRTIHLEAIYKFYLYDPLVGNTELDNWIGPNRKDSLNYKLEKLVSKQLPRLYLAETVTTLEQLQINVKEIEQKVHFQAQLFTPYNHNIIKFKLLNKKCVSGFYININNLDELRNNEFHIPAKLDWLCEPLKNRPYVDLDNFKKQLNELILEKRSPLCWMKTKNNIYKKIFVVWW